MQLVQTLTFEADKHLGTMDEPFVLQVNDATSIRQNMADMQDVELLEVIDNSGRIIRSIANPTDLNVLNKLEYKGIYNFRLTYRSGETKVLRIIL